MFQIERLNGIEAYINRNGRADITELSEVFQVSKVTIRRDLDALEAQKRVIKAYGGAISIQGKRSADIPQSQRMLENVDAKQRIGALAASLIEDNDTIIIDTGTTTLAMIRNITAKNVTVITHDLLIAMEVIRCRCAELIVAGGSWESTGYALTGGQTIDSYRKMHVDKVYIGCDAVDRDFGISSRAMSAVELKKTFLEIADRTVLLADQTKFGKKAFYSLYPMHAVDMILTDSLDAEYRELCEAQGICVRTAEEGESHHTRK